MFKSMKDKIKVGQFKKLKEEFLTTKRVENFNNEYFLDYLIEHMQGRNVRVAYQFGILEIEKQLTGEAISLNFPQVRINDWNIYLKYKTRCSVSTDNNQFTLIIQTDWATPTPDQKFIITF